jgi:membrane protein YdbS with pleckstrin-like domain
MEMEQSPFRRRWNVMGLILIIVLILLLIGAVPSWPYSRGWGYWPSGGIGLILVIVLILLLLGRI